MFGNTKVRVLKCIVQGNTACITHRCCRDKSCMPAVWVDGESVEYTCERVDKTYTITFGIEEYNGKEVSAVIMYT